MKVATFCLALQAFLWGLSTVYCKSFRTDGSTFSLMNKADGAILLSNTVSKVRRLEDGSVFQPEKLQLQFEHNGKSYEIHVERQPGPIKEGATMTIHQEDGDIVEKEVPQTYSYYNKGKQANLNFRDHSHFTGLILDAKESLYFEAKDGKFFINNKIHESFANSELSLPTKSHVTAYHDFVSGGRRHLEIEYWNNCYADQERAVRKFSIGYAVGFELSKDLGFSTTNIMNLIADVTSKSNLIYETQMNVRIEAADFDVVMNQGGPSWNNPGCSKSISQQLYSLQGSARRSRQGLWHLLDKCFGFSGNTLGIAKVGVLCRSQTNVGVSYHTGTSAFNTGNSPTWATVAHELGHNFNGAHSFEFGQGRTGGIMDYGSVTSRKIDGTIQFNTPLRKRQVCAELNRVVNSCSAFSDVVVPTPAPVAPPVSSGVSISDCTKVTNQVFLGQADVFIGSFADWTVASCFELCADSDGCRAFVVSSNRQYCELWTDAKGSSDLSTFQGFDTYFNCPFTSVGGGDTRGPTDRVCQRHRNAVIPGEADVYSGSYDANWDLQSCHEGCLKDENCGAFTFSETYKYCEYWSTSKTTGDLSQYSFYDTYFCFLPDQAPLISIQTQSVDDLVVDFDLAMLKSSCCESKTGQYFLGPNVFVADGLTDEACSTLCIEDSTCEASTFNTADGTCELWAPSNDVDGVISPIADPSVTTTVCSRSCIASIVKPPNGEREKLYAIIAGAAIAVVAFAMFFIVYKRRTSLRKAYGNTHSIKVELPNAAVSSPTFPSAIAPAYPDADASTSFGSGPPPKFSATPHNASNARRM